MKLGTCTNLEHSPFLKQCAKKLYSDVKCKVNFIVLKTKVFELLLPKPYRYRSFSTEELFLGVTFKQ